MNISNQQIPWVVATAVVLIWWAWPRIKASLDVQSKSQRRSEVSPANTDALNDRLLRFGELHEQLNRDGCRVARAALEEHVLPALLVVEKSPVEAKPSRARVDNQAPKNN